MRQLRYAQSELIRHLLEHLQRHHYAVTMSYNQKNWQQVFDLDYVAINPYQEEAVHPISKI